MKKIPFAQWCTAVRTWYAIYRGTKKGEQFANECGFEDLRITAGDGNRVLPFGYCQTYLEMSTGKSAHSRNRCEKCPLFAYDCGFNRTDGGSGSKLFWRYVDAMRAGDQRSATECAQKILEGLLYRCPHPILTYFSRINIKKIRKSMEA